MNWVRIELLSYLTITAGSSKFWVPKSWRNSAKGLKWFDVDLIWVTVNIPARSVDGCRILQFLNLEIARCRGYWGGPDTLYSPSDPKSCSRTRDSDEWRRKLGSLNDLHCTSPSPCMGGRGICPFWLQSTIMVSDWNQQASVFQSVVYIVARFEFFPFLVIFIRLRDTFFARFWIWRWLSINDTFVAR